MNKNKFLNQQDYVLALEELMEPIRQKIINEKKSGIHLGTSGAVYDPNRAEMEALIRPLWGLAPLWTIKDDEQLKASYIKKISQGTDPESAFFWGEVEDYDQYIVEMTAIVLTILLNQQNFWEFFNSKEQSNVLRWLSSALDLKIPKNNWTFFKVLIRVTLFKCGGILDDEALSAEKSLIDSMYVGDGWYTDGSPNQRDYYIAFAFHFYGLIYSVFMKEEDSEWSQTLKERAKLFAQDYIYYFDNEGEALPFGRSLTYRFAQGSFFSALVFANVEAIPWGQIKQILAAHMKKWLSHPIFTNDQCLSIGYHYENLVMAEGYNAPGSPYWSFKTFLLLAVPKEHPFWAAQPTSISKDPVRKVEQGQMLLLQADSGVHLLGYPVGQLIQNQAHAAAKYSKFVYSSKFGFSVSKAAMRYEEGGFDNVLAVSLDGSYYRSKEATENEQLAENHVSYCWSPFNSVKINTEIYPFDQWHVRVHTIETTTELFLKEGGFSIPLITKKASSSDYGSGIKIEQGERASVIIPIEGFEKRGEVVFPEPNTSLYFPRSIYPSLSQKIAPGKYRFISLVGGIVKK
ncbi:DUF2264 domain-containing protein [Enterococcus sp. LJL99]